MKRGDIVVPKTMFENPAVQLFPKFVERVGFISLHDNDDEPLPVVYNGELCILIAEFGGTSDNSICYIASFDFTRCGWVKRFRIERPE